MKIEITEAQARYILRLVNDQAKGIQNGTIANNYIKWGHIHSMRDKIKEARKK